MNKHASALENVRAQEVGVRKGDFQKNLTKPPSTARTLPERAGMRGAASFDPKTLHELQIKHPAPSVSASLPPGCLMVRPSNVPGAGCGLFATVDLEHDANGGTIVGYYIGKILTTSEMKRDMSTNSHRREYLMRCGYCESLRGIVWIDASDDAKSGLARYINDVRNEHGYNVIFRREPERGRVAVVTTRLIAKGEELFVDYGRWYWTERTTRPSRLTMADLGEMYLALGLEARLTDGETQREVEGPINGFGKNVARCIFAAEVRKLNKAQS